MEKNQESKDVGVETYG